MPKVCATWVTEFPAVVRENRGRSFGDHVGTPGAGQPVRRYSSLVLELSCSASEAGDSMAASLPPTI